MGEVNFESKKQDEIREIDLVEIIIKLWKKKKFIFKVTFISAVLGVIIAFSIPRSYNSKVMLVPESKSSGGLVGGMSALAAIAGINLMSEGNNDAFSTQLYPQIVSSTPFLVELFGVQLETRKGDLHTNLYDYMSEHQKGSWIGFIISSPFKLLGAIMSLFKEKEDDSPFDGTADYYSLTPKQAKILKQIDRSIKTNVDKKTGVITITVTTQDPLISALLADTVQNKLQEYITDYRTEKARKDLLFTEEIYKNAREEYFKAQRRYADFMDGNINIVMVRFKTEEQRLEKEMNLTYSVYSQMAQQLQVARAKLQENTPVYSVLQPSVIPVRAASPNKPFILLAFIFLGVISASTVVIWKDKMGAKKK